jgi:hypothetical protein
LQRKFIGGLLHINKLLLVMILLTLHLGCKAQNDSKHNEQVNLSKYAGVYKCETIYEEAGWEEVVEVIAAFSVIDKNLILVFDDILYDNITVDSNKFVVKSSVYDYTILAGEFIKKNDQEGILADGYVVVDEELTSRTLKFYPKIGTSNEADKLIKEALMNQEEFNKFWNEFSSAVLKNDKEKVASMVYYPFIDGMGDVHYKKKSFTSKNETEFLKKYDYLFDDYFKKLIESKKPSQIGKNSFGLVFNSKYAGQQTGWGDMQLELVFEKVNGKYYLVRIPYYA